MTWAKLDDQFDLNEKQLRMSDAAFRVYVCALASCGRQGELSGYISETRAQFLLRGLGKSHRTIHELVALNAWEKINGGWLVHDFDVYVDKGSRDRTRRYRSRLRGEIGDESVTSPRRHGDALAGARAQGGNPVPEPVPVPVPPVPPEGPPTANAAQRRQDASVRKVYEVWLQTLGTKRRDLTPARIKVIRSRLQDSTLEEIIDAVQGWQHDPWDERRYQNDLTILLRNRAQVEKFRDLWREPPLPALEVVRGQGRQPNAAEQEIQRVMGMSRGWQQ